MGAEDAPAGEMARRFAGYLKQFVSSNFGFLQRVRFTIMMDRTGKCDATVLGRASMTSVLLWLVALPRG